MKLAWLCWRYDGDQNPEILFVQPDEAYFEKVIAIVYAEIVK